MMSKLYIQLGSGYASDCFQVHSDRDNELPRDYPTFKFSSLTAFRFDQGTTSFQRLMYKLKFNLKPKLKVLVTVDNLNKQDSSEIWSYGHGYHSLPTQSELNSELTNRAKLEVSFHHVVDTGASTGESGHWQFSTVLAQDQLAQEYLTRR